MLLKRVGTAAAVYALLCLFNILLGAYVWFPRYEWQRIFIPLPEAAASVFFLIGLGGILRTHKLRPHTGYISPALTRLLFLLFTLLFLALLLFSTVEAFFQHVYLRTFDIRANLPLISHFFNMLFNTELFSRPLFLALPALTAFFLLAALFWLLFRHAALLVSSLPRTPSLSIAAFALLLSLIASPAQPAAVRLFDQLFFYEQKLISAAVPCFDTASSAGAYMKQETSAALPGIKDKNIHLAIVESYGTTVFTNPHHYGRLNDFYRQQADLLNESGYHIFSFAYNSTTFGGTSWLADASLLSGLAIRSQAQYDRVVKNATPNLLHVLAQSGYRTVLSAPGSKFMTDEYTGFYAYDSYVLHTDFEYNGPFFTFGELPDQYQLHFIHTTELNHSFDQPFFVQYILCSSHVPWNYIPPYIESWSGFRSGRIFYNRARNTWYDNSWAQGSELFEGYAHSIRYSLESVFGYARTHLDENDILIVIGDHQPKFPVSEKGAGFGVPVHIIAKERSAAAPFIRYGYQEGMLPPRLADIPGLERFLDHFLSVAEGRFLNPRPAAAPLNIPQ